MSRNIIVKFQEDVSLLDLCCIFEDKIIYLEKRNLGIDTRVHIQFACKIRMNTILKMLMGYTMSICKYDKKEMVGDVVDKIGEKPIRGRRFGKKTNVDKPVKLNNVHPIGHESISHISYEDFYEICIGLKSFRSHVSLENVGDLPIVHFVKYMYKDNCNHNVISSSKNTLYRYKDESGWKKDIRKQGFLDIVKKWMLKLKELEDLYKNRIPDELNVRFSNLRSFILDLTYNDKIGKKIVMTICKTLEIIYFSRSNVEKKMK